MRQDDYEVIRQVLGGRRLPLAAMEATLQDARRSRNALTLSPGNTRSGQVVRQCGDCAECCHALGVESTPADLCEQETIEFDKEPGVRCQHQSHGGCAVYQDRPLACRGYACLWVMGWGRPRDRPDKTGVILDTYLNPEPLLLYAEHFGLLPIVIATEVRPGVFPKKGRRGVRDSMPMPEEYPEPIRSMADERLIMIRWYGDGDPDTVIGPPGLVKKFEQADRLAVEKLGGRDV